MNGTLGPRFLPSFSDDATSDRPEAFHARSSCGRGSPGVVPALHRLLCAGPLIRRLLGVDLPAQGLASTPMRNTEENYENSRVKRKKLIIMPIQIETVRRSVVKKPLKGEHGNGQIDC